MNLVAIPVDDFAHVDVFHGVIDDAVDLLIAAQVTVFSAGRGFLLRSESVIPTKGDKWNHPDGSSNEDGTHPLFIPIEEPTEPQFDFERHGAKRITKGTPR